MSTQVYFEDVSKGTQLPILVKEPTHRQLVMYAGASGDYNVFHYDQDAARANGLPNVVVHGALKSAFLSQMLTNWSQSDGKLRKMNLRYRGLDIVDRPIFCKGQVICKYVENDLNLVECDIWTENADGDQTTIGTAVIALPSRSQ